MAAGADFLRAIQANPDDDAPRLVFADWLDENDQAERAAFIRAQIEEQRLPSYDPSRVRWRITGQRLWHKHGAAWLQPLPAAIYDQRTERGFLDHVALYHDKIAALGEVLRAHPVRSVAIALPPNERDRTWTPTLENQRTTQVLRFLQATPEITQLRALQLDFYRSMEDILLPLAQQLPNFAVLPVGHAQTKEVLAAFGGHRLTRLEGRATDADIQLLAQHPLPDVTHVDFRGGDLSASGIVALTRAPWAAQLESMNLNSCGLRPEALRALVDRPWPRLHTLSLEWNWVNRAQATALLTQPKHFPALRYLDLGNNDLYDADIAALADLPLLAQLHALSLRRNAIRARGAHALSRSTVLSELRYLNLSDNFMGDEALRVILRGSQLPKLVSLDLQHNATKADGLYALVDSRLLPQLRALRCTVETTASVPTWVHFFENAACLEALDMQDSILTDEALRAMVNHPPPNLVAWNLNNTPLHDPGLEALANSVVAAQLGELRLAIYTATEQGWKCLNRSALVDSLALLDTNGQGTKYLRRRYGARVV